MDRISGFQDLQDCFLEAELGVGWTGFQDCKNTYLVNPIILKSCLFIIKVFMLHQELTKKIIGCAFTVHNTLGAGFLEKVYEQALILELKASGLSVRSQEPLSVKYRDQIIGEY